jgi:polysaccharide pyruvyl transferase WcaK-like protein
MGSMQRHARGVVPKRDSNEKSASCMLGTQLKPINRIKRIGVFGHVGNRNLGDEAIISAVIQNIRSRCSDAQICGFTLNPLDTQKRHKIIAFPIRKAQDQPDKRAKLTANNKNVGGLTLAQRINSKLKTVPVAYTLLRQMKKSWEIFRATLTELKFLVCCYHNIKGVDLLIIAGSQQLIDYIGGPWAHSYTLFKWSLLAKLVNAKVAFVSVGAGPIHSSLSKFFVRKSLVLASYRSFRDETSRTFVEGLGVTGQHSVFPDLAYSLPVVASSSSGSDDKTLPIVGINPVPFSDGEYWPGANASNYETYIYKLASFALWVIDRGYRVLFFPTQLHLDPPVIDDIKNVMKGSTDQNLNRHIVDMLICSFDDLVSAICMTDVVVATRFHGIIIPYLFNRPVLGIAYQRKTVDLMGQMGQSEYVVDINSFDVDSLRVRFISLESKASIIKDEIKQRKFAFGRALQNQYDQLFSLIASESQAISMEAIQPTISPPA